MCLDVRPVPEERIDRRPTLMRGRAAPRRRECLLVCALMLGALAITGLAKAGPAQGAYPGDNGKIAFETNRDGNLEIYSMNPDGSSQVNLTNDPAEDTDPVWSPDGSRIAFVKASRGPPQRLRDGRGRQRARPTSRQVRSRPGRGTTASTRPGRRTAPASPTPPRAATSGSSSSPTSRQDEPDQHPGHGGGGEPAGLVARRDRDRLRPRRPTSG